MPTCGLFCLGQGRVTDHSFGESQHFNSTQTNVFVALDRSMVNFSAFIDVTGWDPTLGLGIHGQFHVHEFREERQRIGGFDFAGMLEGSFKRAAMRLVFEVFMDDRRPVQGDQNAGTWYFLAHWCSANGMTSSWP